MLKKIEFEKNDNNKLHCLNFLIVFSPTTNYKIGKKFQIRIQKNHFCYAEILMRKQLKFNELIECGYNFIDMGLGAQEYYDYLYEKFNTQKWWNNKETIFNVIFFQKIIQLNLFDNNEIFNIKN